MRVPKDKVAFRKFKYAYDYKKFKFYEQESLQLLGGDLKKGDYEIVYLDNEQFKATFVLKTVKFPTTPLFVYETENKYMECHVHFEHITALLNRGVDIRRMRGIWEFSKRKDRNGKQSWTMKLVELLDDENPEENLYESITRKLGKDA